MGGWGRAGIGIMGSGAGRVDHGSVLVPGPILSLPCNPSPGPTPALALPVPLLDVASCLPTPPAHLSLPCLCWSQAVSMENPGLLSSDSMGLGPRAVTIHSPHSLARRTGTCCRYVWAAEHRSSSGLRPQTPVPNHHPPMIPIPGLASHLVLPTHPTQCCSLPAHGPILSTQLSMPCPCRSQASLHGDTTCPLHPAPPAVGMGRTGQGA